MVDIENRNKRDENEMKMKEEINEIDLDNVLLGLGNRKYMGQCDLKNGESEKESLYR